MLSTALPRRLAVLIGAGAVTMSAVAGCAGTTTTATPAAQPAATVASAAPRAVVPTVAKPSTPAPPLTNTGTAWPTVVGSMLAYGQWLLANPNPALATTITEPGCASATALSAQLQSMLEQNDRVRPAPISLTSISGPVPAPVGAMAEVDVQAVRAAEPVIDHSKAAAKPSTGSVLEADYRAALTPTSLHLTLALGSDKHWRFCGVADALNDPDGEAITTVL